MKVKKLEAQIVQVLLGNPSDMSCTAIAQVLGKPVSTVARVMKNPEVKERLKEILYQYVDKELVHNAVANITRSIVQDQNVADSRWLLEHMDFFPKDQGTDDEDAWEVFQERVAENMAKILKQVAKGGNGDGTVNPDGLILYQPQPPDIAN